jgi:hypothetical protein
MSIDLDALEARLREYDPEAPKCAKKVEEIIRDRPDYAADDEEYYTIRLQHPCCRPEGHKGECRNTRRLLGWPGYRVLVELVAEVRRLRALEREP